MKRSPLLERITLNPKVCHGKPTISNMRYTVTAMLDYLTGGDTVEELVEELEGLEPEDLLACIANANEMLKVGQNRIFHSFSS